MKRELPCILYIDCETLWNNMIIETVPSIPEEGYRIHEVISKEVVNSVCLIKNDLKPAAAYTKSKPNQSLDRIVHHYKCSSSARRVFMLQKLKYHHCKFIPTSPVSMVSDYMKKPA